MNQHLGVPVDPLVELVIRHFSILDTDLVADDEAGLGLAGDDEVPQVPVVCLDITLPSSEFQTLSVAEVSIQAQVTTAEGPEGLGDDLLE